jgi:L-ornithine N5-oxygenase
LDLTLTNFHYQNHFYIIFSFETSNMPEASVFDEDQIYDLICVGFGPASLAIAIALEDMLRQTPNLSRPKVLFLERQRHFAWHSGMLLEGSHMQISFLKDLATIRDPTSPFTFLNYLHQKNRLLSFINLGTFTPTRIEYGDYLKWCADQFEDVVRYGHSVQEVRPHEVSGNGSPVNAFDVLSIGLNEKTVKLTSRHVVVALGGRPSIPGHIPANHSSVVHSSKYRSTVSDILPDRNAAYTFAILGGGQSAAEIFRDLHTRFPNSETTLIIRNSALRPSDDSPFVNEVFDPSRVDGLFQLPPHIRRDMISRDKATNYGVVRQDLLEQLYSFLYSQSVVTPDPKDWKHRILNLSEIISVDDHVMPSRLRIRVAPVLRPLQTNGHGNGHINTHTNGKTNGHASKSENGSAVTVLVPMVEKETELDVDALFVATGYVQDCHERMLKPVEHLRPKASHTQTWQIKRDYSVEFDDSKVDLSVAGIWLQGCNEATHGVSSLFLSIQPVPDQY